MAYNSYETDRLILKPTDLQDIDFIYNLMNSPKWLNFIGDRGIKSHKEAENYITEKHLPNFEANGFGSYTLILKENGIKIGSSGLYKRDTLSVPDIGFAFLPEYEGFGYGYESSKKILEVAQSEFGITTIAAITLPNNTSSHRLIKKLGLSYKKTIQLPGDDEELMYFEADLVSRT